MNEAEILKDIRKRHSTLHNLDEQCAIAMEALTKMIGPASEHKLLSELDAVAKSLSFLHAAARKKVESIQ